MSKNNKPEKIGDILKRINKETILEDAQKEKDKAYDIRKIYEEMELSLISSMKRAFYFHQVEQKKEGFNWEQWQLTKLREIEKYRRKNKSLIEAYSKPIQKAIDRELHGNFLKGQNNITKIINKIKQLPKFNKYPSINLPSDTSEKQSVKEYIAKLLNIPLKPPPEENFFGVNEKKLQALQDSVKNDLNKASQAVLRQMDDVYRQVIYKTHVYMQSGAKTLNQAIDMATKDFLDKGINCIEYKNGARVNIASYAEMALRTASQRATFMGEGKKRDEWGLHLVVVSAHANTCKLCLPWQGKVLIDDVYCHGSNADGNYPLLSEAMKAGLLHPNCRHTLATYFPGITKLPEPVDDEEALKNYEAEQGQRYMERQIRKWKRIEAGSCDAENEKVASDKVKEWTDRLKKHLKDNPQLRRDYEREKPGPDISNNDVIKNAERLKLEEKNAKIKETRNDIKSGRQPLTIEDGKQGKHILDHKNYIEGRSYLTVSNDEVQDLVNKYAGTGTFEFDRKGKIKSKEFVIANKSIGVNIDNQTGELTETNRFYIHYSKNGAHIVPTLKGVDKK